VEFYPKLKASIEEIFATMIFLDLTAAEPLASGTEDLGCHVSAMIGLSGDFNALLGIHCSAKAGLAIGSAMLGMELEDIDDDTKDALGEISNMLAGGIKESFAAENINLLLALPTTISGKSYKVNAPSGSHRILFPCDIEAGRFYIDFKYSPG
jgi:chemotaxis protein CheX